MIKANELRIGNYVYYLGIDYGQGENKVHDPEGDEVAEVLSICPKIKGEYELLIDSRSADGNRRSATMVSTEGIGGIPLTPEWLERCGFKAREELDEGLIYSVLKMDLDISKSDDGYFLYTNNTDPWHNRNVGVKIEYLHQLQNLYFALTGEELNVKP